MSFWESFVRRHNIETKERGKSTHKGNIYIRCPWCRDDKFMMGLNLSSTYYACWRDPKGHGGRDPVFLIQAVLRCSKEQAKAEAESDDAGETDLGLVLAKLAALDVVQDQLKPLVWPPDVEEIVEGCGPPISWHAGYLAKRGFDDPYRVAKYYGMRAGIVGKWQGRILVPFYIRGAMLGWTGRALAKSQTLRYMTEPTGNGIGQLIFNYDRAKRGGKILVACEGPFDAIKIDWFGRPYGIRAVALLGLNLNSPKIELLTQLMENDNYEELALLMDEAALHRSVEFSSRIPHIKHYVKQLPHEIKDPGEVKGSRVAQLFGVK